MTFRWHTDASVKKKRRCYSFCIRYRGKNIFKKHRLEKEPKISDVVNTVTELAGWNENEDIYHREGQYMAYVNQNPAWSVKIYGNSIDTFKIKCNTVCEKRTRK